MIHDLKIHPHYYDAVADKIKTFEIRDNTDRGFQKGDILVLREWNPTTTPGYTGKEIHAEVTYVTNYEQKPNMVVLAIKILRETNPEGRLEYEKR